MVVKRYLSHRDSEGATVVVKLEVERGWQCRIAGSKETWRRCTTITIGGQIGDILAVRLRFVPRFPFVSSFEFFKMLSLLAFSSREASSHCILTSEYNPPARPNLVRTCHV